VPSPRTRSQPDLGIGFTGSAAAMLLVDGGARVRAANVAALQLLELRGSEVEGRHLCEVLIGCRGGDECPHGACPVRAGVLAEGNRSVLPVLRGDGPGRTVQGQCRGVEADGVEGATLLTLTDPTAEASTRSRDFVALVAHELRAPLTVALSHAELLADMGDSFDHETRVVMARELQTAVERMSALVDDLATLGFAAAGSLDCRIETVDVAEALRDALQRTDIPEAIAPAFVEPLRGLPPVRADKRHLGRAAAELILNGRRATEDRGVPEVRGHVEDGTVIIEVVDRGTTLPEPERATAYDRLSRPLGVRRSGRVTPLGVTMARVLVEAMGGRAGLRANQDAGGGCTFWIGLPRA